MAVCNDAKGEADSCKIKNEKMNLSEEMEKKTRGWDKEFASFAIGTFPHVPSSRD